MDPIAVLPDAEIAGGLPVSDAFLGRGIPTFRRACQWVKDLPYGCGTEALRSASLFDDGRGTCLTKHGVIAQLAGELGLSVYKNLGFYRLNDEIVTGVDALLQPYGLAFVPQLHCFLAFGDRRVDLTEGNNNGKNKTIDDYDFVVQVGPDSTREELERYFNTHLERYQSIEPRLAAIPSVDIRKLLMACHELASRRCAAETGASMPLASQAHRQST